MQLTEPEPIFLSILIGNRRRLLELQTRYLYMRRHVEQVTRILSTVSEILDQLKEGSKKHMVLQSSIFFFFSKEMFSKLDKRSLGGLEK